MKLLFLFFVLACFLWMLAGLIACVVEMRRHRKP